MTNTPDNFADPPSLGDAFSDLLESIRLRGGVVRESTAAVPKAFRDRTRLVHVVTRGQVELQVDAGGRTLLTDGTMALLGRGDPHTMNPCGEATWISGEFLVEQGVAEPLLGDLPPVITIAGPGSDWLPLSVELLLSELHPAAPGSRAMISRILELLFIHGLRAWTAAEGDRTPGGLTAALDPALSPALAAVHAAPGKNWTVTRLAGIAHLSRSVFAGRFRRQMGIPPSAYIQRLRIEHAAQLLLTSQDTVATIAHAVGYASEASFSRAFQARHGQPPRRWRVAELSRPERTATPGGCDPQVSSWPAAATPSRR
ncbi:AraC family transcriptional regulator [Pseudonocardia kongjuensis]|uniref:AraC family transcriptional regulator n=1 Tax=Pseudonocardia kongjuensis TaxID=102227 RepID=A0ABN1Y3G5_9PSEU